MMSACFIDTMKPVTPAEVAAWRFFLRLHRDLWTGARIAFRLGYAGAAPGEALLGFVSDTGEVAPSLLAELELVLTALAEERAGSAGTDRGRGATPVAGSGDL